MAEVIEDVFLTDKAKEEYLAYGIHTIEDRAIIGEIDGLKPVTRRALWAAYKGGYRHNRPFVKSARIVGDAMGKYHPHGDVSIYGAIVTAANMTIPLFDKSGNWGTMTDPPAAMRYTECRLSEYAERVFFDKFYLVVNYDVPNYDDKEMEPLVLPALLPNALLNGNFGIAPGVRTLTPTYTLKSLLKVIVATLKAGKCSPQLCLPLEFTTNLGGVLRKTPETKQELLAFYRDGKGRFIFDSSYQENKNGSIRIDRFAPISGGSMETVLTNANNVVGVQRVNDDSSVDDAFNAYTVEFVKTCKGPARDKAIQQVMDKFSATVSFNVQAIERSPDATIRDGFKQLNPFTVPELIDVWIEYRVFLEKKACKHWAVEYQKDIDYLNLMRLAVANRAFIIKALDKPLDNDGLAAYVAKGLKITVEQANQILDLKVRQLRKLEDDELVTKIKGIQKDIRALKERIAKPKRYIAQQIVQFAKELAN